LVMGAVSAEAVPVNDTEELLVNVPVEGDVI
jgi:hypothetical protein